MIGALRGYSPQRGEARICLQIATWGVMPPHKESSIQTFLREGPRLDLFRRERLIVDAKGGAALRNIRSHYL